jgi:hypothetical protein
LCVSRNANTFSNGAVDNEVTNTKANNETPHIQADQDEKANESTHTKASRATNFVIEFQSVLSL